ncbi:MAG: outer membrane protein assembly factor BamC [Planctomycetes bacterium]|nr:outer membrane protein assembly factor BamC [Planctomycetota bacterium]
MKADRKQVWDAAHAVLANKGFTLSRSNRDEWHLETRWNSIGSDASRANHRYRVTLELAESDSGTLLELLVEHESNTAIDAATPREDDWSSEGADEDMQADLVYKLKKLLAER